MNKRSGFYLSQPSGYKSFIPSEMPPKPIIEVNKSIHSLLKSAKKTLAQLDGVGFMLPHPELFISMAIRKEALLSSQIEGTQATMTDLLTYEKWDEIENFDDVQEVVNNIKALRRSIKMLDKLPLGIRIIKEAHKVLMQGVRGKDKSPGEFRRSQNWIGPSLKNAIFIPPPHEEAKRLMSQLEKFINEKNSLDPLIRCALIHYQFETIHPFLDGNGRIGRLLIDLFLHDRKIIKYPLLYISLYFQKNRQKYFDTLMTTREKGNFEQWVMFFLQGIVWSSECAIKKIKQILSLQNRLKQKIFCEKKASIRSIALLDQLFISPLVTINDIAEKLDLSYQGAKDQVDFFVRLNILQELTKQKRGKRYAFASYLKAIEE